jgi:hypothetical protein
MASVPKITSPCPLRFAAMPGAGRDFCGQCQRRVHNLDAMDAAQRREFFAACGGDVCVAYSVRRPQRLLRAGAAAMALSVSGMAFAQEAPAAAPPAQKPAFEDVVTGPACDPNHDLQIVVMGGVSGEVEWLDDSEAAAADRPEIAEIEASEWLPAPAPKAE